MADESRPSLLFVAYDARDLEAARVTLEAGGWTVTAAVSTAHAMRLLDRAEPFDVLAADPRAPGATELVAALANRCAGVALFLRVDAEAAATARASRDRGVVGCGSVVKLAGLAPLVHHAGGRHVVSFTTVLRVAWFARSTVAVRIGVEAAEGAADQVVVWLDKGEPLDASFGEIRGVDAVSRLVPGSVLSGKAPDVVTTSVVTEYETSPGGATIRCGMPTLLDLFDDDSPVIEVMEEEIDTKLWTDAGWNSQPPPEDPLARDLTARAGELDGVLEAVVVDASGTIVSSVGASAASAATVLELWSAIAVAVAAATPGDTIEEVVVAGPENIDVLSPLFGEARALHVRFNRRLTNHALARAEVRRICSEVTAST